MSRDETPKKSATASPPRRETIGAVEHAIDLLRCLSEASSAVGVNDIARRIGLHKSSVSRIAKTLENVQLIQRDSATGRLSLGMGMVTLAASALASFDVRDVVRPLLSQLAAQTGETCSFSVWDGHEAVSIEQAPGSNSVRAFSTPGHRNPGHATAAGKVLLAHMGEAAIEKYCAKPLHRFTDRTITDPRSLKAELARCRAQLCAINTGEFERDVGAVSAIAFDRQSQVFGAVTATAPLYRFAQARRTELAKAVIRCAAELSEKLGTTGLSGRKGAK
jgi:DNA-binding IclR family transcriptional regulator